MAIAIDLSCTLALLFPDYRSETIAQVILTESAIVPVVWPFELGTLLLKAEKQGRISRLFRLQTLADLSLLPIRIDSASRNHAWDTTSALADEYGLTLNQASYLELALREDLLFATFDTELERAAKLAGIAIFQHAR